MTSSGGIVQVCKCPPWMSTGGSAMWCERCERPKGFAAVLHAVTTNDSQNEPPDVRTDDDFEI